MDGWMNFVLNHSVTVCILTGKLRSLTFQELFKMYMLIEIIVLFGYVCVLSGILGFSNKALYFSPKSHSYAHFSLQTKVFLLCGTTEHPLNIYPKGVLLGLEEDYFLIF